MRLLVLLSVALIFSGCSLFGNATVDIRSEPTPNVTNNSTDNSNGNADENAGGGERLVDYENKAIGYRIMRPDKWYWQHYNRAEIGSMNPLVDDYFVADPNPLPGLGSEYIGRIVIEVSSRPLSDYADAVVGFSVADVKISGLDAKRYVGIRNDLVLSNQKVIEYQLTYNNHSFRIRYVMVNSTAEDEALFEDVVASFKIGS